MSLTRRQFLAAGALGTAGAAVAREATSVLHGTVKPWNASTGRGLRKYRNGAPTACTLCPARCAITAYRDGDRVVQVGPHAVGAPLSGVCARAYEALEALYDPERVVKPLRRKGRRGEGKWQEIPWSEALGLLGEALARSPETACADLGCPDPVAGAALEALGVRRIVEEDAARRWASLQAQRSLYGMALGRPDLSRAKTILLLGSRPLDEGNHFAPLARDLVNAKIRGASVIAVGAYEGATGSFATEWVPVRPGSEAELALGLLASILGQGGADAGNVGRTVATPLPALLQLLAPFGPERVQAATGVQPEALNRLARRLVVEGPLLCLTDGADSEHQEALEAAAAVLNALSGDPESAGLRLAHRPEFVPALAATQPRSAALWDVVAGTAQTSVYLAYRSNPVYRSPQGTGARKAFADEGRIGLLVAMDSQLTETAALADLVLPAATDLELWNLFGGYTPDGRPYALLQQPVTRQPPEAALLKNPSVSLEALFDGSPPRPLGEARQLGDVLLAILERGGHAARSRFPAGGVEAVVRALADAGPLAAAGGFRALAKSGVWVGEGVSYPWGAKRGFPVKGGKVDVRDGLMRQAAVAPRSSGGDEFSLVVLQQPELSTGYANSRWGREIRHRNPLLMNAASARRLGLGAGDHVTVRTEDGHLEAEVLPIQGIHPQAVALADDFGHWAGGVAATAQARATGEKPEILLVRRRDVLSSPLSLSRQTTEPGETPWWHEHGPGASVWALRGASAAEGWSQIRCTVRKA